LIAEYWLELGASGPPESAQKLVSTSLPIHGSRRSSAGSHLPQTLLQSPQGTTTTFRGSSSAKALSELPAGRHRASQPSGLGLALTHALTLERAFASRSTPMNHKPQSASMCRHFAAGKCSYGGHCKLSHDIPAQTSVPLNPDAEDFVPTTKPLVLPTVLSAVHREPPAACPVGTQSARRKPKRPFSSPPPVVSRFQSASASGPADGPPSLEIKGLLQQQASLDLDIDTDMAIFEQIDAKIGVIMGTQAALAPQSSSPTPAPQSAPAAAAGALDHRCLECYELNAKCRCFE
jgi:hypothetical protein